MPNKTVCTKVAYDTSWLRRHSSIQQSGCYCGLELQDAMSRLTVPNTGVQHNQSGVKTPFILADQFHVLNMLLTLKDCHSIGVFYDFETVAGVSNRMAVLCSDAFLLRHLRDIIRSGLG